MTVQITLEPTYLVELEILDISGIGVDIAPPPEVLSIELTPILRGLPGPPGSTGTLDSYIAGATLSGHTVITLDAIGLAVQADCRQPLHANALLGISLNAALAGDVVEVRSTGLLEHLGWGLTPSNPIFLGENGAVVQTPPPTAAFVKCLGYANSSSTVIINLQPAIFS